MSNPTHAANKLKENDNYYKENFNLIKFSQLHGKISQ